MLQITFYDELCMHLFSFNWTVWSCNQVLQIILNMAPFMSHHQNIKSSSSNKSTLMKSLTTLSDSSASLWKLLSSFFKSKNLTIMDTDDIFTHHHSQHSHPFFFTSINVTIIVTTPEIRNVTFWGCFPKADAARPFEPAAPHIPTDNNWSFFSQP